MQQWQDDDDDACNAVGDDNANFDTSQDGDVEHVYIYIFNYLFVLVLILFMAMIYHDGYANENHS